MHPAERVRIVTATARAVLDGRLDAAAAVPSLRMQVDQIAPHLRSDRLDVTQREAESVALTLRRLAEQVSERANDGDNREALVAVAEAIGTLAQSLR